jgi:hypothetical protein
MMEQKKRKTSMRSCMMIRIVRMYLRIMDSEYFLNLKIPETTSKVKICKEQVAYEGSENYSSY